MFNVTFVRDLWFIDTYLTHVCLKRVLPLFGCIGHACVCLDIPTHVLYNEGTYITCVECTHAFTTQQMSVNDIIRDYQHVK